jgi:hypothetical protein
MAELYKRRWPAMKVRGGSLPHPSRREPSGIQGGGCDAVFSWFPNGAMLLRHILNGPLTGTGMPAAVNFPDGSTPSRDLTGNPPSRSR